MRPPSHAPGPHARTTAIGPRRANTLPRLLGLLLPALVFSAFLTQVKFLPQIRNNVGMFEVLGTVLIVIVVLSRGPGRALRVEPTIIIVGAIFGIAALSQLWIAPSHRTMGLIQVLIMGFMLLFLICIQNLTLDYRISPVYLLACIIASLVIVGPWIMLQGSESIQAAGPFRNRAHMASYMLTGFWMALMLALWPTVSRRLRYLAFAGVGFTLYAVAVSGRRSTYLSLAVGLAGLGIALFIARRERRGRIVVLILLIVLLIAFMYFYGADISPRLSFFRDRVGMVGGRLLSAVGQGEEELEAQSFFALQRQGVMMAFTTSPVLGIGWGGFPKSPYSPTGHEVHSTPMRFLAELGIVGLLLYLLLEAWLLWLSTMLFIRMRRTAFSPSFLVMTVALWSLNVSYLYNRHLTERTFWLLMGLLLTMRVFAGDWLKEAAARRSPSSQPAPRRSVIGPEAALGLRRTAGGRLVPLGRRRGGGAYG